MNWRGECMELVDLFRVLLSTLMLMSILFVMWSVYADKYSTHVQRTRAMFH